MFASASCSFALSQFFGLYLLIMAIIMYGRAKEYRHMVQDMTDESGPLFLAGSIGLMLGLFLIGIHNIWVFAPVVTITVLCWLVLIMALLCLTMPSHMIRMMRKLFSGNGYYALVTFMGIVGIICIIRGIYIYVTHHYGFLLSFAHTI